MSLINQMLRDLDERREVVCTPANVHLPRRRATKDNAWSVQRRILVWSGGSLLVALLSVAFVWYGGESVAHGEGGKVSAPGSVNNPVSQKASLQVGVVAASDRVIGPSKDKTPASSTEIESSLDRMGLTSDRERDTTVIGEQAGESITAAHTLVVKNESMSEHVPTDKHVPESTPAEKGALSIKSESVSMSPKRRLRLRNRVEDKATAAARRAPPDEAEPVNADIRAAESAESQDPPQITVVKRPVESAATQADQTYHAARGLLDQGRLAEFEAHLRRVLEIEAGHREAREMLALLLLRGSRLSEASNLLTEGLKIAPHHSNFAKLKARVLIAQGNLSDAIEVLEAIASGRQIDLERLAMLAAVYQQQSDHVRAVKAYRELLRYSSRSGVGWAGLAISLDAQGEREAAVQSYRRALGLASLAPEVRAYARDRIIALTNIN